MISQCSPLFSAINRRSFNRTLRAARSKIQEPATERFSSHACRRWTSNGRKESFPPWSAVATSGAWRPPAFALVLTCPVTCSSAPRSFSARTLILNRKPRRWYAFALHVFWETPWPGGRPALPGVSGFPESVRRESSGYRRFVGAVWPYVALSRSDFGTSQYFPRPFGRPGPQTRRAFRTLFV